MTSAGKLLQTGADMLRRAGLASPRREARLLLAHMLGRSPEDLIATPEMTVPDAACFQALLARRAGGEPRSRIVGNREFRDLDLRLTPDVLDPRPDSETLIDAALRSIDDACAPYRVLDLGVGSGCLLLALLQELPNAFGLGCDLSERAVAVARANARHTGLADRAGFLVADWGAGIAGRFDLLLANPPYIPTAAIARLAPEVRDHDPLLALDGGGDGLTCYRALVPELRRLLATGGRAFIEIGQGQAEQVRALCRAHGLAVTDIVPDLADIPRCLVIGRATDG